ncbi:MAG TPA: ribosomal protein S18-alanine N-acetyltransferase [Streptosporangiaceae bacterium]
MTAGDLAAVLALERALFAEDAWTREMFTAELAGTSRGRFYLVAEDDGEVVGYAGLLALAGGRPAGGQADVLTMAVATARWGQGIGSALLEALLAEAGSRGCVEVFLEVRVDNLRAQGLYARYGFSQIGLRRGYYQPSGTDAIVMRRPMDSASPASSSSPATREGRP